MEIEKVIGQAIVKHRKMRHLSQERFAQKVKISRHYMSDIENGKRKISVTILLKIATELGVSIEELVFEQA